MPDQHGENPTNLLLIELLGAPSARPLLRRLASPARRAPRWCAAPAPTPTSSAARSHARRDQAAAGLAVSRGVPSPRGALRALSQLHPPRPPPPPSRTHAPRLPSGDLSAVNHVATPPGPKSAPRGLLLGPSSAWTHALLGSVAAMPPRAPRTPRSSGTSPCPASPRVPSRRHTLRPPPRPPPLPPSQTPLPLRLMLPPPPPPRPPPTPRVPATSRPVRPRPAPGRVQTPPQPSHGH
jgi:hypothetical protein